MAAAEEDQLEALYQPTCLNVQGARWTNFGYALIGGSTIIMACQSLGIGPNWIWKSADDATTVLFTFELLVRIFEKGYLFFVEDDKNWNFFDALVVAISLFSMVMSQQAAASANGQAPNGAAMQKMKVLRTLRLLRLLRLFRVFKGVEEVNRFVELLLNSVRTVFLSMVIVAAGVALVATAIIACGATAKAWLRDHSLPKLPEIH
ncbi:SCN10A [Symbiodinium natans]|uniref:SCN10A protein n=1 Tax=Symbiodinium natans TaxID=878477 RepID=A0A812IC72_9DINO|nr:SCN10A [Symbiodinium natans]